ncbi:MAG TPA: substrate-binding domain-containing protein, partial [Magnetospirillaceae bacterium]|nr:substrate-binding domain-containing protein [Magnetospirillaceae bacterium]
HGRRSRRYQLKRSTVSLVLTVLCAAAVTAMGGRERAPAAPANPRIRLATTTSTENSGLLGHILPLFEARTGYYVHVVAVGTGAALRLGENGDADLVLVHARAQEDAFVAAGHGVDRRDVMHNDFIIIGPAADPAGIRGAGSAAEAFSRIASAGAVFVSRGDRSGTHVKEQEIWRAVGVPPSGAWYKESGQGMEQVILMANSLEGYTLTDRGTWLAVQDRTNLKIAYEGDKTLFNPYGIIAVNPTRWPAVNHQGAKALMDWMTSREGRAAIEGFKLKGEQLFFVSR